MWKQAQEAKLRFIKQVSDIEIEHLRRCKKQDICFVWLDELLLGIEVNERGVKKVYYDEDIRRKSGTVQEARRKLSAAQETKRKLSAAQETRTFNAKDGRRKAEES